MPFMYIDYHLNMAAHTRLKCVRVRELGHRLLLRSQLIRKMKYDRLSFMAQEIACRTGGALPWSVTVPVRMAHGG